MSINPEGSVPLTQDERARFDAMTLALGASSVRTEEEVDSNVFEPFEGGELLVDSVLRILDPACWSYGTVRFHVLPIWRGED